MTSFGSVLIVLMSLAGFTQSARLRNAPLLVYDYDNTPLSRTELETYGAALTFRIKPCRGGGSRSSRQRRLKIATTRPVWYADKPMGINTASKMRAICTCAVWLPNEAPRGICTNNLHVRQDSLEREVIGGLQRQVLERT